MPTERPPLLGEVVPTFADRGCCVVSMFYINIEFKCNLVSKLFILFPGVLDCWINFSYVEAHFHCSEVLFLMPIHVLPLFISQFTVFVSEQN
jgi:hypothetical protein